jgi:hypothetical protein
VHSRNTYIVWLVPQDPFVHGIQGHRHVYGAYSNSKNVYSLGHQVISPQLSARPAPLFAPSEGR